MKVVLFSLMLVVFIALAGGVVVAQAPDPCDVPNPPPQLNCPGEPTPTPDPVVSTPAGDLPIPVWLAAILGGAATMLLILKTFGILDPWIEHQKAMWRIREEKKRKAKKDKAVALLKLHEDSP